jgi:hypothetical protein
MGDAITHLARTDHADLFDHNRHFVISPEQRAPRAAHSSASTPVEPCYPANMFFSGEPLPISQWRVVYRKTARHSCENTRRVNPRYFLPSASVSSGTT